MSPTVTHTKMEITLHNADAQAAASKVDTIARTLDLLRQGCAVKADKAKSKGDGWSAARWANAAYELHACQLRAQKALAPLTRLASVADSTE